MCKDFNQGLCGRGAACKFLHDPQAQGGRKTAPIPRDPQERCGDWKHGRCTRGSKCRFVHEGHQVSEKFAVPKRALLCTGFRNGHCSRGAGCQYKHEGGIEFERPPVREGQQHPPSNALGPGEGHTVDASQQQQVEPFAISQPSRSKFGGGLAKKRAELCLLGSNADVSVAEDEVAPGPSTSQSGGVSLRPPPPPYSHARWRSPSPPPAEAWLEAMGEEAKAAAETEAAHVNMEEEVNEFPGATAGQPREDAFASLAIVQPPRWPPATLLLLEPGSTSKPLASKHNRTMLDLDGCIFVFEAAQHSWGLDATFLAADASSRGTDRQWFDFADAIELWRTQALNHAVTYFYEEGCAVLKPIKWEALWEALQKKAKANEIKIRPSNTAEVLKITCPRLHVLGRAHEVGSALMTSVRSHGAKPGGARPTEHPAYHSHWTQAFYACLQRQPTPRRQ